MWATRMGRCDCPVLCSGIAHPTRQKGAVPPRWPVSQVDPVRVRLPSEARVISAEVDASEIVAVRGGHVVAAIVGEAGNVPCASYGIREPPRYIAYSAKRVGHGD